jgi:hypothetical protein
MTGNAVGANDGPRLKSRPESYRLATTVSAVSRATG